MRLSLRKTNFLSKFLLNQSSCDKIELDAYNAVSTNIDNGSVPSMQKNEYINNDDDQVDVSNNDGLFQVINFTSLFRNIISMLLITVMLAGIYFTSAKKAEAGMIVGDHRYTNGAVAADMAQCAALIAIWYGTRLATRAFLKWTLVSLRITCSAGGIFAAAACGAAFVLQFTWVILAEIAAATALYLAWLALEEWASATRKRTHILNNFDEGQPNFCEKFDHRNPRYEYGSINRTFTNCNMTVYTKNPNYNKIAILYDTNNELSTGEAGADIITSLQTADVPTNQYVWIAPYDCKQLDMSAAKLGTVDFSVSRWVCAYEEDGQLCADSVFCTSLEIIQFIKFILPGMFFFNKVTGYVADPVLSSSDGTRNCGTNPWTGNAQDDYKAGDGRCECACCENTADRPTYCDVSNQYDAQGNALDNSYPCTTYNERYRAHCIPRGKDDVEIDPPVSAPSAISAYCDASVNVGYTPFPLAGKLMRCFEKTLNNVFYGTTEIVTYDVDGKPLIEDGAIVMETECSEGNVNANGFCDSSMFMKVMSAYQDIVTILMTFFICFIGIRLMMGANYGFPELFKMIMKISLVAYFAIGDAWKDGYYNTLLTMGSELGAEYTVLTDEAYEQVSSSMSTTTMADSNSDSIECSVTAVGSTSLLTTSLDECNFTGDAGYDGAVYLPEDQHYAAWDTLDCKFATYTGFTVTKTFPYIVSFAWAMLLSVSTGFMTLIAAVFVIFASLVIILSALYVGILVLFNLTVLIYIAPLAIPLVMFEPTKSIFTKWIGLLIGYSLQPMILFALLSFVYAILDQLFMSTMPQIFSSEVNQGEIAYGLIGYTVSSSYDFTTLVISMIKFTIAIVIISSLFKRTTTILRNLTGADVQALPDFGKAVSVAAKQTAKYSGNAAKFSARYAKERASKQFGAKKREQLASADNFVDLGS
ncbi:MAG: type IV secretion system protein [Rickettsiales bacterium]|nr:type IV secretion system protein [Rickettsiales bacterium]